MYRVDADKGFNHAPPDDAFVCQKKNHFQITVHVGISGMMTSSGCTSMPKFIRLPDEGGVVPIDALYLHFYGIKVGIFRQITFTHH
jgi:myelin regulatory factor